jgi:hypothetical protein
MTQVVFHGSHCRGRSFVKNNDLTPKGDALYSVTDVNISRASEPYMRCPREPSGDLQRKNQGRLRESPEEMVFSGNTSSHIAPPSETQPKRSGVIGPECCPSAIARSTMASWRGLTAWFRQPKQRLGVAEPSRTLRPSFTCLQESWTTPRLAYP